MTTNSLGSFRDVYPWKHHWSKDIDGRLISLLTPLKALYDEADFWTYGHHWTVERAGIRGPSELAVDIYWKDDGFERGQVPPHIGGQMVEVLIATVGSAVELLIWNHEWWRPGPGFQPWTGEQGDFVDHIHVEFTAAAEE